MSILSDREIISLCEAPKYVSIKNEEGKGEVRSLISPLELPTSSMPRQIFNDEYEGLVPVDTMYWLGEEGIEVANEEDLKGFKPLIEPFIPHQVKIRPCSDNPSETEGIISFGLSSYSYDFRVAPEFLVFTNTNSVVVDPLKIDEKAFVKVVGDKCIIPPNSFVLARTIEYFSMSVYLLL